MPKHTLTFVQTAEGLKPEGLIPWDAFQDEKQGKQFAKPIRARGSVINGVPTLQFDAAGNPVGEPLKQADGMPLFMRKQKNGAIVTIPKSELNGPNGQLKPDIVTETVQASVHTDFRTSITPDGVVWPDGKIRAISVYLKAKNPMTAAEYAAKKQQATAKRATTSVQGLSNEALLAELARRNVAVKAAGQDAK
jgi:hypothetical protein